MMFRKMVSLINYMTYNIKLTFLSSVPDKEKVKRESMIYTCALCGCSELQTNLCEVAHQSTPFFFPERTKWTKSETRLLTQEFSHYMNLVPPSSSLPSKCNRLFIAYSQLSILEYLQRSLTCWNLCRGMDGITLTKKCGPNSRMSRD